jgi:hypothetical protein
MTILFDFCHKALSFLIDIGGHVHAVQLHLHRAYVYAFDIGILGNIFLKL